MDRAAELTIRRRMVWGMQRANKDISGATARYPGRFSPSLRPQTLISSRPRIAQRGTALGASTTCGITKTDRLGCRWCSVQRQKANAAADMYMRNVLSEVWAATGKKGGGDGDHCKRPRVTVPEHHCFFIFHLNGHFKAISRMFEDQRWQMPQKRRFRKAQNHS